MIYTKKNARSLLNVQFLCMDRSKGRVAGLQTIRSAWTPTGTIWTAIPANPLADGTLSDISLLALPLMAFSHFHPNFLWDCPAISLGKSVKFFVGCQIQIAQAPTASPSRIASQFSDDRWGICFFGNWCGNRWLLSKHVLPNRSSILFFQSRALHHKVSEGNLTQNATLRQFPAGALPGSFSHTPEDWHRTDSLSGAWSC